MSQPLILIIEDEASLRRFLVPTLANNDYQVLTAATGADGPFSIRLTPPGWGGKGGGVFAGLFPADSAALLI